MDTLKKIANKKLIAVAMIVETIMILLTVVQTISNSVLYGFTPFYLSIIESIIKIAGIAIIVYSLLKNKKDMPLLIGVGMMVLAQIFGLFSYITIYEVLYFVAWVAVGLLTAMVVMSEKISALQQIKKYSNIIGIISALIFAITYVLNILVTFIRMSIGYWLYNISQLLIFIISSVIGILIFIASYGLFAIYMGILAQGEEESDIDFSKVSDGVSKVTSEITGTPMTMSLGIHVVLLLFTCGIWHMIWIYKVTGYLNSEAVEKRTPVNQLLLCMFIPFYHIYWVYKSASIIDSMYKTRGKHSDISTMCLILAIFVNFVPPIIMQDKINSLDNGSETGANTTQTVESQNAYNTSNDTDEIREYKKLLDEGLITEEEYEAKKKQIMGL